MQDELDLLCTHGILHLLGYDHAEPDEHATMFGLQDRLLAAWRSERVGCGRPGHRAGEAGQEHQAGRDNRRAAKREGQEGRGEAGE